MVFAFGRKEERQEKESKEILLTKEEKIKFEEESNHFLRTLPKFHDKIERSIKTVRTYDGQLPEQIIDNLGRFLSKLEKTLMEYQLIFKNSYFKTYSLENKAILIKFFKYYFEIYSYIFKYKNYPQNKEEILSRFKENNKNLSLILDIIKEQITFVNKIKEPEEKKKEIEEAKKNENYNLQQFHKDSIAISNFLNKLIEEANSNPNKFYLDDNQKKQIINRIQEVIKKSPKIFENNNNLTDNSKNLIKLTIINYENIINIIKNNNITSQINIIGELNRVNLHNLVQIEEQEQESLKAA